MESIYQNALCIALSNRHIPYVVQKPIIVQFETMHVGTHKLDLVVGNEIVVELKAVNACWKYTKNSCDLI